MVSCNLPSIMFYFFGHRLSESQMAMWRWMQVSSSLSFIVAGNLWIRYNTCKLWCLLFAWAVLCWGLQCLHHNVWAFTTMYCKTKYLSHRSMTLYLWAVCFIQPKSHFLLWHDGLGLMHKDIAGVWLQGRLIKLSQILHFMIINKYSSQ